MPLEEVMNIKEDVGPQSVNHFGQLPAVNISFGLKPGVSLGTAIDHVNQVAKQVLPATVTTTLPGIGEGVPGVAVEPQPPVLHCHRRRLHRARDALRELHPSDHDSVRSPVGRARRAA